MTDRAIIIACGNQTLSLYRRFLEMALPGIIELVPADDSLLIVLESAGKIPEALHNIINSHLAEPNTAAGRQHRIVMRFDGEDLGEVCEKAGLPEAGLIALICSLTLKVKFLGFQPGFAYLEGLPPELRIPRLARPRKNVPRGSVALGGGYCGIYPAAGPGGWHLIGTTDIQMFNPGGSPPALLQPGDEVRLVLA